MGTIVTIVLACVVGACLVCLYLFVGWLGGELRVADTLLLAWLREDDDADIQSNQDLRRLTRVYLARHSGAVAYLRKHSEFNATL